LIFKHDTNEYVGLMYLFSYLFFGIWGWYEWYGNLDILSSIKFR
jgi:hypothetical protein